MRLVLYNDDGSEAVIWPDVQRAMAAGGDIRSDIDTHLRLVHTLKATRFILASLNQENH